ncbi:MAG: hypothetical protein JSV65_03230 [Armatimonadota bacterium]|nr:MAG: hypothetical protein JSV65_03230 [Armatimonadota bacterium]
MPTRSTKSKAKTTKSKAKPKATPKPRRRRVSEAMEQLAHHYLADEIFEVLLNRGHAAKVGELTSEVLGGELDPKLLRKVMANSPRFSVHDRRWNLAMRQVIHLPLAGALAHHLRSYGRPLSLPLLANEMAVIAKQPISAEEYQELLPRIMEPRRKYFRTPDGAWGLSEWLLDIAESDEQEMITRNFFLASKETLRFINKLDAACPSARASDVTMALAVVEAASVPVPHKILSYLTWKRRGEAFDPIAHLEELAAEDKLHMLSAVQWIPSASIDRVMAALRELSKEAAEEEIKLLPGEEMAAVEELAVSPTDLEEIHTLIERRKRPVPTGDLVTSIFEISPTSPSFPLAIDIVNEGLTQDESLGRMGKATWGVPEFVPEHIQDIPEILLVGEVDPEQFDDPEADAPLEDEGLEEGLATWVHDPRYEDFGEEDEIELSPDHAPATEIRYPLPYDHWKAGTIKIREADRDFFPPETQLVYAVLHPAKRKVVNAWVNQFSTLVYDLEKWYKSAKVMPGAIISLTRADEPDHYALAVEDEPDPLLGLDADRIKHLESLCKRANSAPWSVFEIMCRIMPDHSKGLHFMKLWAEVNVVRRTPRRTVASNLSAYHAFFTRPAASDIWVFDERKVEQGRKKAKRKFIRR